MKPQPAMKPTERSELSELLESARQKSEAACAVLMDTRCVARDAVPLLYLGWVRCAEALRRLSGKPTGNPADNLRRLGDALLPGMSERERPGWSDALGHLTAHYEGILATDPALALSRSQLMSLALTLRGTTRVVLNALAPFTV